MAARHCSVKNGSTGSGAKHSDYISGQDKYAEKGKEEVVYLASGNMPDFARENPTEFWKAADKFERANYTAEKTNKLTGEKFTKEFKGRAYKEIEFSIPREITDRAEQIRFAKEFAEKIVGKNHPHTLAIHNATAKDGKPNVNAHLMLSERVNDGIKRTPEKFFSRAASAYRDIKTKQLVPADPAKGGAKKDRDMNAKGFVQGVREKYQTHAKSHGVDLDMRSNKEQWLGEPEPKLGPIHNRSKDNSGREARQETINQIRAQRKENEHSSTSSVNAIGKNISRASRAGQFSKPDFTGITENLRAAIGLASNNDGHPQGVAKATSQYKHAREAGGIAQAAGKAIGGIIKEITRATSSIETSLEAIKKIETVKSVALPQKSLTERIAESLEAFVLWVKGKDNSHLREINLERSEHTGRIEQLSDYHAVQNLGRGYAIHELDKLDLKPQLQDMATIKYRDGRGAVQIETERSKKDKGIAD